MIWHAVTIPLTIAALWLAEQLPAQFCPNALAGGLLAFGVFFCIWWSANRWYQALAFGFGDVMLAMVLGSLGGLFWGSWMLAVGMLLAGGTASLLLFFGRNSRLDAIPYGTFLAAGGFLVLLYWRIIS